MRKTILIITHVVPEPANAGDSLRVRNLIQFFKSQGYKIVCLFKGEFNKREIIADNEKLIDHIYFASDFCNMVTILNKPYQALHVLHKGNHKAYFRDLHLALGVKKLCRQYDPYIVMAEYIFMAPYLSLAHKLSVKIVDTIDVFARKAKEVCRHGVEFPLACSREEERRYLLHGNLILGIQPDETDMLRGIVPERKVINVGVDMPTEQLRTEKDKDKNTAVILIVAGGNANNVHGVNLFIAHSWKHIHASEKNVRLRIAGSVCKHISANIDLDGVELLGIVQDLRQEYRKADVVVNPVIAGTGLKIKTIEAMSYGKAVVSTPNGVEGVLYDDAIEPPFIVADSSEDFVEKILFLLKNEAYRADLEKKVLQYSEKYLSSDFVFRELSNAVIFQENDILLRYYESRGGRGVLEYIRKIYDSCLIFKSGCYDKAVYCKHLHAPVSMTSGSVNSPFHFIKEILTHPVLQYVFDGVYRGFELVDDFDTAYYLKNHPELFRSCINPYSHYLCVGKPSGESPANSFVSIDEFCSAFGLQEVCSGERGSKQLINELRNKHTYLFITHSLGGGANKYLYDMLLPSIDDENSYIIILSSIRKSADMVVSHKNLRVKFQLSGSGIIEMLNPDKIAVNSLFYYNEKLLKEIVKGLLNSNADIKILFHDYFYLCPTVNLIDESSVFCGLTHCDTCRSGKRLSLNGIVSWRKMWQKLFDKASEVVFFSEASLNLAAECFEFNNGVVRLIPHKPLISYSNEDRYQPHKDSRPVVGVVGLLSKAKGAEIVLDMAINNPEINFVIIGSVVKKYLKQIVKLDNIIVTGAYSQKQLPEILRNNNVNIVAVTSVWPETFCYVLQEVMQLEYPVVAFNIGAQGERVCAYKYGMVCDRINADAMMEAIRTLKNKEFE